MENQNHALIDWISFSLPIEYTAPGRGKQHLADIAPVVEELFGRSFQLFTHTAKKLNFYRHRYTLSTPQGNPLVHVFIEPDTDNNGGTTLFMVTGYGLSNRPDALTNLDPVELLRNVKGHGGRLTRIDLALDDFAGRPILAQMRESCQPDIWRDRTITTLCRGTGRTDKPVAIWEETLYLGHRQRGNCICAYDKRAQLGLHYPWFRLEFTTRDRDLCSAILEEITAGVPIGKLTAGIIHRYLRFVPPGRRKKADRPECRWWTDFLSEGAEYKLARHQGGKIEDAEPKKAPSRTSILRYLREAQRLDTTGEVVAAFQEFFEELHLAAAWQDAA